MFSSILIVSLLMVLAHPDTGSCLTLHVENGTEESVREILETTRASAPLEVLVEWDTRIKRQATTATQATRFKKMMKLLQAGKLQDCAGRVVCDLNCDAGRYGSSGEKVLAMMNKVQEAGIMDVEDMQLLGAAGASGRVYYWTTGCSRCRDVYPSCFSESEDLIDVASIFDVDSF